MLPPLLAGHHSTCHRLLKEPPSAASFILLHSVGVQGQQRAAAGFMYQVGMLCVLCAVRGIISGIDGVFSASGISCGTVEQWRGTHAMRATSLQYRGTTGHSQSQGL